MGPQQVIRDELIVTHYVHGMVPWAAWLLARLELLFALCAGLSCPWGWGPRPTSVAGPHVMPWAQSSSLGVHSACQLGPPSAGSHSCARPHVQFTLGPCPQVSWMCKQGEIYGRLCLSGEPGGFHSPISRPLLFLRFPGGGEGTSLPSRRDSVPGAQRTWNHTWELWWGPVFCFI